jgi:hypothetical protein
MEMLFWRTPSGRPLPALVEIDLLVVGGVSRLTLEFGVVEILNFECRLTEAYAIGGRILSANPGFRQLLELISFAFHIAELNVYTVAEQVLYSFERSCFVLGVSASAMPTGDIACEWHYRR